MIAVRPPEYFPRAAYFALLLAAEHGVVADTVPYSRQSYQNRARLRTPQGWQWMSVPLRGGQHGRPIEAVEIDPRTPWARKHWRSLVYNYQSTPFFAFYEPELKALFGRDWPTLGALTSATLVLMHRLLGLPGALTFASALPGPPASLAGILRHFEAPELLALPDSAAHDRAEAPRLRVLEVNGLVYRQNFAGFVPDLSVLDLLFNYGPEAVSVLRAMLPVVPHDQSAGAENGGRSQNFAGQPP